MRRISLALALVGAVAATGCGQSSKPANTGGNRGIEGSNFKLTVRGEKQVGTAMVPAGGLVTGNGINCGVDATGTAQTVCEAPVLFGATVALQVTSFYGEFWDGINAATVAYDTYGFAGACSGAGTATGTTACTFTMNSDRFVAVRFGHGAASLGSHADWHDPALHAGQYFALTQGTGVYACADCHGANLQGAGLAPACSLCHTWPLSNHFVATRPAWGDHGTGWSAACNRCHTSQGFQDYAGNDGSANYAAGTFATTNTLGSTTVACTTAGTCDPNAYAYGPLKCETCHTAVINPVAIPGALAAGSARLDRVFWFDAEYGASPTRPSLKSTTGLDASSAICVQCHQAREGGLSVNQKIANVDPNFANTLFANSVMASTSFLNPHYRGAAAIYFGAEASPMVQYPGQIYTGRNEHGGAAACTYCHNAHTLEMPQNGLAAGQIQQKCGACHYNEAGARVSTYLELEEARQFGFEGNVDGDANPTESIKAEIDGVAAEVYANLQDYAVQVVGTTITYTDNYPYYMDAAGKAFKAKWTPRLMRAAVNYKWYKAEPAAWAHNPRYMVEVLFDTIADLRLGITESGFTPTASFNSKRAFNGHFGGAEDASPYAAMVYHSYTPGLGNAGFTSAACYQCHGGKGGFDAYLATAPAALTSGVMVNKVTAMQCSVCHAMNGANMTAFNTVGTVYFPPQKATAAGAGELSFAAAALPPGNAICATCHSGRENGATIDLAIGAATGWTVSFKNPHYLGAAGMMMGTNAKVMYEYAGNTYTGYPAFWSLTNGGSHGSPHGARCASCHAAKASKHSFEINLGTTVPPGVWGGAYPIAGMQPGASNTAACNGCHAGPYALAPVEEEYLFAVENLYTTIQAYGVTNLAAIQAANPLVSNITGVCYDGNSHPYFFLEINNACSKTQFKANPALAKASFNLLWAKKEPGAWAHNEFYVMQVIYDTIVDLGETPNFVVKAVTDRATGLTTASPLNRPANVAGF